jgi:hypothetical protein
MDKGDYLGEAGEELVAKGDAEPNECTSITESINGKAYTYTFTSNHNISGINHENCACSTLL